MLEEYCASIEEFLKSVNESDDEEEDQGIEAAAVSVAEEVVEKLADERIGTMRMSPSICLQTMEFDSMTSFVPCVHRFLQNNWTARTSKNSAFVLNDGRIVIHVSVPYRWVDKVLSSQLVERIPKEYNHL